MSRLGRYIIIDLLKNKVIIGYFCLLLVLGWGTFMLGSQPEKVLLMLMRIVLLVIPMTTMAFTSIYYYNSQEFIELLLSQPIGRATVFRSFYFGLSTALIAGYCLGLCLPLLIFYPAVESFLLIGGGIFLILIFTALALYVSVVSKDKVRGLGFVLLLWALFAFLYDGILLFMMYQFADYPVEKPILVLTLFNPIDIARILIIMKTEASAMLGVSGAVFQQFFSDVKGITVSTFVLILWIVIPFFLSERVFMKKDM